MIQALANRPSHFQQQARSIRSKARRAVSLLEVVLALSILAVASAYLAQSMHIATENALRAETLTQAEMVAESVMNQVVAGAIPNQGVSWSNYTNPNPLGSAALLTASDSQWMYMVTNMNTEVQGMICVQVGVKEVMSGQASDSGIVFYLNRWIIDPSLGLDTPPANSSTTNTSSSSGSSASPTTGSKSSTGGVQ